MVKIYSVLFLIFCFPAAFGQNGFKYLNNSVQQKTFPSDSREFLAVIKHLTQPFTGLQKAELAIIGNIFNTRNQIGENDVRHLAAVKIDKTFPDWSENTNSEQRAVNMQEPDNVYSSEKNKVRQKELENTMLITRKWNNMLTVLSSLLVIFILLLLYSLRLLSKNKKKIEIQKQSIFAKNAVLKRNIQEKEFLVRELNHRVKNNLSVILSLVGFQRDETQDKTYKPKFEQLYSRINTISLGHNLFSYHLNSFDKSTVGIKEYSEKIFESHKAGFAKTLVVESDLEQVMLPVDKGLSYGLLLNELLTNSLKHAVPSDGQPLKISLCIKENNGLAEMKYCDNGMFFGINDGSNSLGHFIIDAMVQQLDGTFEREESCYQIVFSINGENLPQAAKMFSVHR